MDDFACTNSCSTSTPPVGTYRYLELIDYVHNTGSSDWATINGSGYKVASSTFTVSSSTGGGGGGGGGGYSTTTPSFELTGVIMDYQFTFWLGSMGFLLALWILKRYIFD